MARTVTQTDECCCIDQFIEHGPFMIWTRVVLPFVQVYYWAWPDIPDWRVLLHCLGLSRFSGFWGRFVCEGVLIFHGILLLLHFLYVFFFLGFWRATGLCGRLRWTTSPWTSVVTRMRTGSLHSWKPHATSTSPSSTTGSLATSTSRLNTSE